MTTTEYTSTSLRVTGRAALLLAAALAAGAVLATGAEAGGPPPGPPPPSFVQSDGLVRADHRGVPTPVAVAGPDGRAITDGHGHARTVTLRIGEAPPVPAPPR